LLLQQAAHFVAGEQGEPVGAVVVADKVTGAVVGVALGATVEADFLDQAFFFVVVQLVTLSVFVDQGGEVALGVVLVLG
jgi:hypothetical protein